jgi:hypothetical protein
MLAYPTGTESLAFFSLLFYKKTAMKYFHNLKWGSIPKYPSHSTINVAKVLQLNLVMMQ